MSDVEVLGPEGLVDEDSSLEAVAEQSGVTLPVKTMDQQTFAFTSALAAVLNAEAYEATWETKKQEALDELLRRNGIRLTFDTYLEGTVDATFGRWTLEITSE